MKVVLGVFAAIVVVVLLGWALTENSLLQYQFFAPRTEAVRREVFENTKSYNQGMIQELQDMEFQYEQADPAHQDALRSIILHRAADYDVERLPPDLNSFISHLRSQK